MCVFSAFDFDAGVSARRTETADTNAPHGDQSAPTPSPSSPSLPVDSISRPDTQASHSAYHEGPNPPDMGAVYILLGCLAVSGLVVLGILIYCTAHCWRKRCFKTRRSVPTIKISSTTEEGYVALKQIRKSISLHCADLLRLRRVFPPF